MILLVCIFRNHLNSAEIYFLAYKRIFSLWKHKQFQNIVLFYRSDGTDYRFYSWLPEVLLGTLTHLEMSAFKSLSAISESLERFDLACLMQLCTLHSKLWPKSEKWLEYTRSHHVVPKLHQGNQWCSAQDMQDTGDKV